MIRLLLWGAAIAALTWLAAAVWSAHRRRRHQRAVEAVLGWARASVRHGVDLEDARSALLDQNFHPVIEQGEAAPGELLFVKELHGYPLLGPVEIWVRIRADDAGRIARVEHRAVTRG